MITFVLHGIVREAESGIVLPGLFVKAYDKDLLFDDLLGSTYTRHDGTFKIITTTEDFRDFFDVKPDIYLKIYSPDTKTLLYTTKDAIRWQAGRIEEFKISIPRDALGDLSPSFTFNPVDEAGEVREDFEIGESLYVRVEGLRANEGYEFEILDDNGERLFTSVVNSDRYGTINSVNLWPQIGLVDPHSGEPMNVEKAVELWAGRKIGLRVVHDKNVLAEHTIRVAESFKRPLILSTDKNGVLLNGFEVGKSDATIQGYNLPFMGSARVYMVPRQHDWQPLNPIKPVSLLNGRPAYVDVNINEAGNFIAVIAQADELTPGAYDFIVRQLRYGYEDDEHMYLRATDHVTRRVTGLVVREEFMASKFVLGGCSNVQQMSGRHISGAPYFKYADTFGVGEDIWAALDPLALDPSLIGKIVAFYVIEHKDPGTWLTDTFLNHLPQAGVKQVFKTQPGCINHDDFKVWENAQDVGEYDIVADFGNNVTDMASFLADDHYNQPLDLIDGYTLPGFRIVPDPTVDTRFDYTGHFSYSEGTIPVVDDGGGTVTVEQKGIVYFPTNAPGYTDAVDISPDDPNYPLVIVIHGNSWLHQDDSYLGYNYLLEHLAQNGFIAASVHQNYGMKGTGRARVLFAHIDILKTKFGTHLANNIGIMGHSRGGEGVAIAARLNKEENLQHNIYAVISLAPTDQYTFEVIEVPWATPYLVIYGSMDGDVAGGYHSPMHTGFALYDRAKDQVKSMVFVYGSTHCRYNTIWGDDDMNSSKLTLADLGEVIDADAHEKIAKGYMTAFFRWHMLNQPEWEGIFRGDWIPAAVEQANGGNIRLFIQYENQNRLVVDNLEGIHNVDDWKTSTEGGSVSHGLPPTLVYDPEEDELCNLDVHSPHDTGGLKLRWDNTSDYLRYTFDSPIDASNYYTFSFRVTQMVDSNANPTNMAQDLYVELKDTAGVSRMVKASKFGEIPYPHIRGVNIYTKSAMCTIRIPLHVYTMAVLNQTPVNLSSLESLAFRFDAKMEGEIEIDSLEFTQ